MRKSGYAQRMAAKKELEIRRAELFAVQYALDAATLSIADVFGAGPQKAEEFGKAFSENLEKISAAINEDRKDDPDLVYSREMVDRALLRIVGKKNFVPWEGRYGK